MTDGTGEGQNAYSGRNGVQSIDRAVAILRCFTPRNPELGISDVARATGLSTSTAHRLLVSMQHNRLVRQTANRRYALGPLLVQLVRSGALRATLRDAAQDNMRHLRDVTDETVGLHELLPSRERVVIDQVESHQPLRRTYTEIGVPIPLPHGAPGKVLLAFLPRQVREEILRVPLQRVTPATVTDPEQLREQLARIRETGYACSFSERTPGIRTVAAAIFDDTDAVVGCMSVSGPEMRMHPERMLTLSGPVTKAAWATSDSLGASVEGVRRCAAAASDE